MRTFKLGEEPMPKWFKECLDRQDVELIFRNNKLESARFYDYMTGKEKEVHVGNYILDKWIKKV